MGYFSHREKSISRKYFSFQTKTIQIFTCPLQRNTQFEADILYIIVRRYFKIEDERWYACITSSSRNVPKIRVIHRRIKALPTIFKDFVSGRQLIRFSFVDFPCQQVFKEQYRIRAQRKFLYSDYVQMSFGFFNMSKCVLGTEMLLSV